MAFNDNEYIYSYLKLYIRSRQWAQKNMVHLDIPNLIAREITFRNATFLCNSWFNIFFYTYFKNSSFSLRCQFQVLNPDGTPAKLVELVVEPGPMRVRSGDKGIAILPINTDENTSKLTISVSLSLYLLNVSLKRVQFVTCLFLSFQIKTNDPAVAPHRQSAATLEVLPYSSTSNSYIHIGNVHPPAPVWSPLGMQHTV